MGVGYGNPSSGGGGSVEAADLIQDGASEIDGDQVDIDFSPDNYTPATDPAEVDDADHLSAHLAGIDDALATLASITHASEHLAAGGDSLTLTDAEIASANKDGATGTASMRTLGTGAQQACAGDDSRLSDARTPTSHAASHQNAGSDEINVGGLSGTLADAQTPASHASDHERGGSDEIDGDHLDIDLTPVNYTPSTTPAEAANADDLAAHLAGIDDALGTVGETVTTTGELELVDVITVTAATQTVTFGTGGDGANLTPLDGDTDEEYVIAGHWIAGATATTKLELRPNALATNQSSSALSVADGGSPAGAEEAVLTLATIAVGNAGAAASFRATFQAKSGYVRAMHSVMGLTGDDAADTEVKVFGGGWRETSTNITTLDVRCDTASGIGVGTKLYLYKRRSRIGTAVSAGALEYIDTITLSATATTVTFGTGGDGVKGRPLDGNTDKTYVCEFYFPDPGSAFNVTLQPNGVSTNQVTARHLAGAGDGQAATADLRLHTNSQSGRIAAGTFELQAVTGQRRTMICQSVQADVPDTTSGVWTNDFSGMWDDTTTNITTLDIVSSAANALASGTVIKLYRRTEANVRADSANSYERHVTQVVAEGASTTESTVGRPTYSGSLVGVTVQCESAVTAGSITVNVKVGGATKLTATLDTTNTTTHRAVASIGTYSVVLTNEITVEIIGSADYTNAASDNTGVTVNVSLTNESLVIGSEDLDVTSRLWVPPESPNGNDDEFRSTTLDSSWTITPAASTSDIDAYSAFASGGPRYAIHTDWRRSWLMIQPDTNTAFIHRAYTLPTNVLIWAECSTNLNNTSIANNDTYIGIGISATSAGAPDWLQDGAILWLQELDNGVVTAQFDVWEGGSQTHSVATTDSDRRGTALCYVAIHKIGTVLHGWAGTANGQWIYMGSETYTGAAMDRVHINCGCNSGLSPGNPISGINFIRFVESATFLP